MRDFRVHVPGDCIASELAKDNAAALSQMKRFMGADIRPSTTGSYLRSVMK
ncbi:MAG: hypothetical protein JWO08_4460 [Verrucomicrobiaceae bacterium]|nr:hypothetical protein [Verrucomicrobiaceae bacterium]